MVTEGTVNGPKRIETDRNGSKRIETVRNGTKRFTYQLTGHQWIQS